MAKRSDCECPPADCAKLVDESCQGGQQEARDQLITMHRDRIRRIVGAYLRRRVSNFVWKQRGIGEFEDYVQHAYVRVISRMCRWNPPGYFCNWLNVVVTRTLIDYDKSQSHSYRSLDSEHLIPVLDDSSQLYDYQDLKQCIEKKAAKLPSPFRETLEKLLAGNSVSQIADALRVDRVTIYRRLVAIRDSLRPCIESSRREPPSKPSLQARLPVPGHTGPPSEATDAFDNLWTLRSEEGLGDA
jgi:RNA polymerase sigma factor (sigma-70 family)